MPEGDEVAVPEGVEVVPEGESLGEAAGESAGVAPPAGVSVFG